MFRTVLIAALLFAAGCSQQDKSGDAVSNEVAIEPSSHATRAAVPSVEGSWRVTMITGESAGGRLTAAIGGGKASLSSGCLRRAWTYTQSRNLVGFTASPGQSTNCGRTPSAAEETAFGALGDANTAIFGKDGNDVTLSGPGGTLTLERR
ncbi:MAG: hypothetical protein H0W65_05170 [Sphingomonas sp.]|uniref:hypothetical protein n=1 Tax=Sphingomonas sp. TaxID=28214 RepID=UPI0017A89D5C|nr:hypothetical protein [Sphingomonas sp.]MBA3667094.1 hypothetical protein [Sphingomonas sp.]